MKTNIVHLTSAHSPVPRRSICFFSSMVLLKAQKTAKRDAKGVHNTWKASDHLLFQANPFFCSFCFSHMSLTGPFFLQQSCRTRRGLKKGIHACVRSVWPTVKKSFIMQETSIRLWTQEWGGDTFLYLHSSKRGSYCGKKVL